MNHAGRVFPSWLLSGCIGWMAGFGQAGSAILPFLTGALASKVGIKSLQPLCVPLTTLMGVGIALTVCAQIGVYDGLAGVLLGTGTERAASHRLNGMSRFRYLMTLIASIVPYHGGVGYPGRLDFHTRDIGAPEERRR